MALLSLPGSLSYGCNAYSDLGKARAVSQHLKERAFGAEPLINAVRLLLYVADDFLVPQANKDFSLSSESTGDLFLGLAGSLDTSEVHIGRRVARIPFA
jgi:hypothetical protein